MITAHLAFVGPFISRPIGRRRFTRLAMLAAKSSRRLAEALGRPRRQLAPPALGLNDHLRRDIGLPPLGGRQDWRW